MRVSEGALADQVQTLTSLVRRLETEVLQLKRQLAATQERLTLVESRTQGGLAVAPEVASAGSEVETAATQSGSTAAGYQVGSERETVARGIGKWIRRCLRGELRGLSGRERINLQSRIYLVVRDIQGQVHDPPLVFDRWKRCAEVVIIGKDSGDSIYIGRPTKTEARIALSEAGLIVSPALRDERHGS